MTAPVLLEETNISEAWKSVLERIMDNSGMEISPLILSLTEFKETKEIRSVLDSHLASNNQTSIQTVSETIFPQSLYQYCELDRNKLYQEYLNNICRIKKIDPRNRNGTYFERMIAFKDNTRLINQIEIIIASLKSSKIRRRSKFQISIFDPRIDHTNLPYQGFPCLQHVTFYRSKNGGLIINSFYAIQHLYRKAYGNWIGLINLGKFIAAELEIELEKFNCHVGVEQLDKLNKGDAKKLLAEIYSLNKHTI